MKPIDPRALRADYSFFLRDDRVLLTGHSHQAWPDVARDAMTLAFDDAAAFVDDKWERAFEAADAVRSGIAARIGARPDEIALGSSTHELLTRFLSALDLKARPHVLTTTGEFHAMHRQLARLSEERLEVEAVPWAPVDTLAERLAARVRPTTAALMVSTVLFETASVVPHLSAAVSAAHRHGAAVLLDAYHGFAAMPMSVADFGGEPVFVTAGGYKYAQWGEGNCFLRVPPGCALRPVYTGWFSDFANLSGAREGRAVGYGPRGADRFAGSTYDPTSHYRARAVIDWFDSLDLTLERCRALSLAQTGRLMRGLEGLDVLTPRPEAARGAFVAVRSPHASTWVSLLRKEGIYTDARGDVLRLGPALYVTDDELDRATDVLQEIARR